MFRKLTRTSGKFTLAFTAMAALCLTASASAQALTCIALPVDNPALRDNGVTERVGDIKILCQGGAPTPAGSPVPHFNLQVFTSPGVNITSRNLGGDVSDALLLFDEPASAALSICGSVSTPADSSPAGTCSPLGTGNGSGTYSGAPKNGATPGRPNAFIGRFSGPTSVVFSNIPFDPPGSSGPRVMRLTNIRVNASQLNNVRGGATSVSLIISTTSSGSGNSIQVPIGNQAPTVGIAQTAVDFTVSSATFLQCESQNVSGNSLASPLTPQLSLKFTERFNSAFRRRSAAIPASTDAVPAPGESAALDTPQLFESESGFHKFPNGSSWNLDLLGLPFAASLSKAGLADSGTRLVARFKNLPTGVSLYAANHGNLLQVSNPNAVATGHVHGMAATSSGDGAFSSSGPTGVLTEVFPISGTATATWEVISTNTNVTESVTIPIAVAYLSVDGSRPGAGSASADGQLAPLSISATASATASVPRFVEDSVNNNRTLLTIPLGPCAPRELTINLGPPGGGSVTGPNMNCSWMCATSYVPLNAPTFTANPAPGFAFAGWSGACSGTSTCTPDGGTSLVAAFTQMPSVRSSIGIKSGPSAARIWPIIFAPIVVGNGVQALPSYSITILGFTLTQTSGAACTAVVTSPPPSNPFTFNSSSPAPIGAVIDFSACASSARFRLSMSYVVNGIPQSLVLNNQFQ